MKKIIRVIKHNLEVIFSNKFFTTLEKVNLSEAQWKRFFVQKYGSVGYFLDFLQNGSDLAKPHSIELSQIFLENLNDETGYIDGKQQEEYRHENWRIRSLAEFYIAKADLQNVKLIPSTQLHSELLATLPKGHDFLEYCGALLFLEIFVALEMKHLIEAFERTIPGHFPTNGYDRSKAPNNVHEYWYNHAEHDPHHFKQIKTGVENFLLQNKDSEMEINSRLMRGIEKCFIAKMHLYDIALMEHMLS